MRIDHPLAPVWALDSRCLILGSFPSVQSRAREFYYGHPQNRFWPMLAAVCGEAVPATVEEKTQLLLRHGLALWDVIASCEITGSADSTIRDVVPNDLRPLLAGSQISRIVCNGATAHRLYTRHLLPQTSLPALRLPSTSPANATYPLPRLIPLWSEALLP